ncbi:MAG: SAM-dependent methyltransferase [Clostridia bacterium]|nr:SAM-dependent methyltransferase [Clostridia bacterium]
MELTPRLNLAAAFCLPCKSVIDVGCDHAYLCIHLVEQGAERAFASDIRPGPLAAAKEHIAACGMSDRVRAVLCPGLEAFGPEDADTVSVCGMGGEMIASILEAAPWTAKGSHKLVLQPMTNGHKLRQWLADNGYAIEKEALAREGDRIYVVMQVLGGRADGCGRENHYLFTEKLLSDPLFPAFAEKLRQKYEKSRQGKRSAGLDTSEENGILKRLEEVSHGA